MVEAFIAQTGGDPASITHISMPSELMPNTSREQLACCRNIIALLKRVYEISVARIEFNTDTNTMTVTLMEPAKVSIS